MWKRLTVAALAFFTTTASFAWEWDPFGSNKAAKTLAEQIDKSTQDISKLSYDAVPGAFWNKLVHDLNAEDPKSKQAARDFLSSLAGGLSPTASYRVKLWFAGGNGEPIEYDATLLSTLQRGELETYINSGYKQRFFLNATQKVNHREAAIASLIEMLSSKLIIEMPRTGSPNAPTAPEVNVNFNEIQNITQSNFQGNPNVIAIQRRSGTNEDLGEAIFLDQFLQNQRSTFYHDIASRTYDAFFPATEKLFLHTSAEYAEE